MFIKKLWHVGLRVLDVVTNSKFPLNGKVTVIYTCTIFPSEKTNVFTYLQQRSYKRIMYSLLWPTQEWTIFRFGLAEFSKLHIRVCCWLSSISLNASPSQFIVILTSDQEKVGCFSNYHTFGKTKSLNTD